MRYTYASEEGKKRGNIQLQATNRDQYTLYRRISPSTSLLSFALSTRKLVRRRSTTKREAPSCTELRASAALHATRKRVAGCGLDFFKYSCNSNSTRTCQEGKAKRTYPVTLIFSLSYFTCSSSFFSSFSPSFRACRSNREASWHGFWPLDGTNLTRRASGAHLYHADVRHLTSFPTRSADLLDLSCSRCALGTHCYGMESIKGVHLLYFFLIFSYISHFLSPKDALTFL